MATPADQRLLELLEKWLKSLELHIRYSSLDDDSYSKSSPGRNISVRADGSSIWPCKKPLALRVPARRAHQNGRCEIFRLAGIDDLSREFDRLGAHRALHSPGRPRDRARAAVRTTDRRRAAPTPARHPRDADCQRPGPAKCPSSSPSASARAGAGPEPRSRRAYASAKAPATPKRRAAKPRAKPPGRLAAAGEGCGSASRRPKRPARRATRGAREQVIADAARLVQWGRKWYELAELIARMADRPLVARSAAYTKGQQDGHRKEGRTRLANPPARSASSEKIYGTSWAQLALKGGHDHDEKPIQALRRQTRGG